MAVRRMASSSLKACALAVPDYWKEVVGGGFVFGCILV
jgi:hypothetical protein